MEKLQLISLTLLLPATCQLSVCLLITQSMRPIATDVTRSMVCLSVCVGHMDVQRKNG